MCVYTTEILKQAAKGTTVDIKKNDAELRNLRP